MEKRVLFLETVVWQVYKAVIQQFCMKEMKGNTKYNEFSRSDFYKYV